MIHQTTRELPTELASAASALWQLNFEVARAFLTWRCSEARWTDDFADAAVGTDVAMSAAFFFVSPNGDGWLTQAEFGRGLAPPTAAHTHL
jgi:hypothetical protein